MSIKVVFNVNCAYMVELMRDMGFKFTRKQIKEIKRAINACLYIENE